MRSDRPLRSVLFVGMSPEADAELASGLAARGHLGEFASLVDALRAVETVPFEAVVAGLPFPSDGDVKTFISRLRGSASACRAAAVVLLASGGEAAAARAFVGQGVNAVLARDATAEALAVELEKCAEVAPRAPLVVPIRIEAPGEGRLRRVLAQTANLSASGAFVRMGGGTLPDGETVRFEITLPGDREPLRGEGEVVRRREAAGLAGGVAIHFTQLPERDRERIAAAVAQWRQGSRATR